MKLGLIVGTPDLRKPLVAVLSGANLEENLHRAAGWGYDGVELALRDPALLDGNEIKGLLAKYHLELISLCTGEVWGGDGLGIAGMPADIAQAAEGRMRSIIEFAGDLGENVMINIGRARGRIDPQRSEQSWNAAVVAFQRLSDFAAPLGVRLALEPVNHYEVNFILSTQDGIAFADDVSRPNFGLMLDTYHMNIEDQDIHASFGEARKYCWHVHVSDNNRKWPGNAHIDFQAIVATLADIGYDAYLSAEILPWPDVETAGQETIRHMRRWVPKVW